MFQYIEDHAESEQKIFFDGQIYDAFSLITTIIQKAKSDIVLIDGYVDVNTLNILAKKNAGKKCFGISLINDPGIVEDLLNRLKNI